LRSAADAALDVLAGTVRAVRDEPMQVIAWSLVHGFAMLLLDDRLDDRLKQLMAKLPHALIRWRK
jgi:hypothetical protein